MSLDNHGPLLLGIASLAAGVTLLWRAWLKRPLPARDPMQASAMAQPLARQYRPDRREAYQLSARRVMACILASLLGAISLTLALAAWLPLPALEKTLVATLAGPVLWPALLIVLVTRSSLRQRHCVAIVLSALLLSALALPSLAGQ